jgi:hypothetical protein
VARRQPLLEAPRLYWKLPGGGGIFGTVEGVTNAGTARPAPFPRCQGCEDCNQPGLLTGKLPATGSGVPGIPVPDFNVEAVYRLAWDPLMWDPLTRIGSDAPVVGTLEGVIIMPCQ